MKDLTSSSYTFEKLIRGNFLYVDKTEFIWKLVRPATGLYFLSRPRRFGKSLTLSTLKAVFEGRRELFEGLAIAKKGYGWKPHPVIHLDLGNCDARTPSAAPSPGAPSGRSTSGASTPSSSSTRPGTSPSATP